MIGLLLALAANLGLLGSAWIVGWPATRVLGLPLARDEKFSSQILTGIGFLGLGVFLVGQLYYTPALGVGITASGGVAVLSLEFRRQLGAVVRTFCDGWTGRISLALVLLLTLAGLAEPVGSGGNDGISYHLLGPKVWLREGRIGIVLDQFHTTFPATIETLFGVVMGAASPRAAGSLGGLLLALFLLQVLGLGRWLGGERAGKLAMVTVACMPVVLTGLSHEFVDLPFAAFALMAIRIGLTATRPGQYWLAGCFLGFAAGTKYTGLVTAAVTLLIMTVRVVRPGGRVLRPSLLVAGIVAVLIGGPWYLRNWYLLGTPIYPPPFLRNYFSPRGMTPAAAQVFLDYIHDRGKGLGHGPLDFALLPFRLTYFSGAFHGAGGIGLIPFGLAWVGIRATRGQPAARYLAAWAVLLTMAWFVTQQEARFLIHAITVAAVFGACGAVTIYRGCDRILRGLTTLLMAVSLGYGAAVLTVEHADEVRAVLLPTHAAERRRAQVPYHRAFDFLNRAPGVRLVLILDVGVPPYYLDRPYLKPFGFWGVTTVEGINSVQEAVRAARSLRVSHILDVRAPRGSGGQLADFVISQDNSTILVWATEDARVYALE